MTQQQLQDPETHFTAYRERRVLPHLRKHFASPLKNQPLNDGRRPYQWQIEMCGHVTPARMFYLFLWQYIANKERGILDALRYTSDEIVSDALSGQGNHVTNRKWLRHLIRKGIIRVERRRYIRVEGAIKSFPDQASYIYINFAVVDQWLFDHGYGTHPVEVSDAKSEVFASERNFGCKIHENVESELHTQQVQNCQKEFDFASERNFVHTSISVPEEDPLTPNSTQESEDQDSPSKSTGTPSSDFQKAGKRHLTWNIGVDPIPAEPMLQAFARHRWCRALAALLQIQTISQPEARKVLRAVSQMSSTQMLWVQLYLTRKYLDRPWSKSWDALLTRLEEAQAPQGDDHHTELDAVLDGVQGTLCLQAGPEPLRAVYDAVAAARSVPLIDDNEDAMEVFAATWREYLRLRTDDRVASYAWRDEQIEFMVIRPTYHPQPIDQPDEHPN